MKNWRRLSPTLLVWPTIFLRGRDFWSVLVSLLGRVSSELNVIHADIIERAKLVNDQSAAPSWSTKIMFPELMFNDFASTPWSTQLSVEHSFVTCCAIWRDGMAHFCLAL